MILASGIGLLWVVSAYGVSERVSTVWNLVRKPDVAEANMEEAIQ